MAYIDISGVSKTFVSGETVRPVLHEVSLGVERGEFVSIVGSMGCGKSTLLHLAAGLLSPDAGHVSIDGRSVDDIPEGVAIVFQNYSLLPWFSALENVRLAVAAAYPAWPRDRQRGQAMRYLDLVGLGNAIHRRPAQLSGGMRQRVAIARAFAIEPSILFLDEPFGALDAMTRGSLQQELAQMCSAAQRPVTTLMISNSIEEAILLSERIVPMTRGPRATLGEPIAVDLARPRTLSQLLHDESADRVRTHVVARLTEIFERPGRARRPLPPPAAVSEPCVALAPAARE